MPPESNKYPNQPQRSFGANDATFVNLNGSPMMAAPVGTNGNLQVIPLPYHASNNGAGEEQDFNLRQFLSTIRRRIWVVTGVAAMVTLVSWVNALNQRPVYQGNFRLLIEDIWSSGTTSEILSPSISEFSGNDGRITTQLEVLRSPAILKPIHAALISEYPSLTYEALETNLKVS
ncbi:MAG: hypothetical protein RLZZ435_436, partial [Cyanobacteriota bacterium]